MEVEVIKNLKEIAGDHMIFSLEGMGANITIEQNGHPRSAWAKYKPPEGTEILVAYPLYTGAGPTPANCYSPQHFVDSVRNLIHDIELSLVKAEEW